MRGSVVGGWRSVLGFLSGMAAVTACSPTAPPPLPPKPTPGAHGVASSSAVAAPAVAPSVAERQPPPTGSAIVTPPPLATELAVVAVAAPAKLNIDGDASEWAPDQTSTRMLYIAPTPDGLVLAVELPDEGKTVSLVLTTPIPRVPAIGWVSRGGWTYELNDKTCKHEQIRLPESNWGQGKANPPEVVRRCHKLLSRRKAFVDAYYARFVRRFELKSDGVTMDGKPIDGMVGAVVKSVGGTVEVKLPLDAMPEVAEAPLTKMLALAAVGPVPKDVPLPIRHWKEKPDPRWVQLNLEQPVAYAPHAAIRAIPFQHFEGTGRAREDARSYHPAEPNRVTIVDVPTSAGGVSLGNDSPGRQAVRERTPKLYELIEELGDVKLGLVTGGTLVTTKDDAIVHTSWIGKILGLKRREGQLHLFSYREGAYNPFMGLFEPPRWLVVAVRQDGMMTTDVADEGVDFQGDWGAWSSDPKPFHDKAFTKFGMRGLRNKRGKVVTWRWNADKKHYDVDVVPKNATVSAEREARWAAEEKAAKQKAAEKKAAEQRAAAKKAAEQKAAEKNAAKEAK